jgi:hypothetical protein
MQTKLSGPVISSYIIGMQKDCLIRFSKENELVPQEVKPIDFLSSSRMKSPLAPMSFRRLLTDKSAIR